MMDDDVMNEHKVTGSPDVIYLNYGDIDRDTTHVEVYRDGEVTWSDDRVDDSDVEYVRRDFFDAIRIERDRLQDIVKELQDTVGEWQKWSRRSL